MTRRDRSSDRLVMRSDQVVQDDLAFLMYYDNAVTREGAG
jgi:hypothetical protein